MAEQDCAEKNSASEHTFNILKCLESKISVLVYILNRMGGKKRGKQKYSRQVGMEPAYKQLRGAGALLGSY